MFGLGVQELMIILVIVIIVFGASRLPQIGEGMGKMISNFRKSTSKKAEPQEVEEDEAEQDTKTISS